MTLQTIKLGKSNDQDINILLSMANRHGLIAGATGTGKTVTLQRLADGFSKAGVSVFLADVKGDLAGIAKPARVEGKILQRIELLNEKSFNPQACPCLFWDLYGKSGHPLRATISDMGPLLLTKLLDLSEAQSGILNAAFKISDDEGLLLLDLNDLKALLGWMADNAADIQSNYGNVTKASVGAIQRAILQLETAGAHDFFGEPSLKLEHFMQRDFSGQGVVSVLDASRLIQDPRLYGTFLLWLLSELFEELPEVGDVEKPKLVFFFDEAHLLFQGASKILLERIEQVVKLIRSKGVGIYFVTQNPLDIPESVLGQLGNRVQHALRAFTPKDQKAVKIAAETFRPNPSFKVAEAITELAVGEALVSFLDGGGIPVPVQRTLILPPQSYLGTISGEERAEICSRSPIQGIYEERIDRESAYELLQKRVAKSAETKTVESSSETRTTVKSPGRQRQSIAEAFIKSAARSIGNQVGRQILRGVLGSLMKR